MRRAATARSTSCCRPSALADAPPPLPELTEPDLVRHFVNLSTLNMSVDTHFYPLGSCTMKYNPKRNERLAALPGMVDLHPYQPDEHAPGDARTALRSCRRCSPRSPGCRRVSLQPAAGAHGELTALLVAAAYFRDTRRAAHARCSIPDSAHGTNPASAAMAGFDTVDGQEHGRRLRRSRRPRAPSSTSGPAVFMITNPNTLGLFERPDRARSPRWSTRRAGWSISTART